MLTYKEKIERLKAKEKQEKEILEQKELNERLRNLMREQRTKNKELKKSLAKWRKEQEFCKRSKTWAKIEEIQNSINLHRNRNLSTFQCPLCKKLMYLNHLKNPDDITDTWIPKHKKLTKENENLK